MISINFGSCCSLQLLTNLCTISSIMTKYNGKMKNVCVLIPIFGIISFVILYIIATLLYPGGSQVDKHSVGFSWINNYWCNLLYEKAINDQQNPAKPLAITGMLVLCLSLTFFWFIFPGHIRVNKKLKIVIQTSGTLAMTVAIFLFTDFNHDFIINLASGFGLIATVGVLAGLYRAKWVWLFAFGILNIFIYRTKQLFLLYNRSYCLFAPYPENKLCGFSNVDLLHKYKLLQGVRLHKTILNTNNSITA